MDLFDYMREKDMEKESPLASRLRPRTWMRWWGSSILWERISCCTGHTGG